MRAARAIAALAALAVAAIVCRPGDAQAKGGASVSVTTTASITGSVVSGTIEITNAGSTAVTVTAVSDSLEVRFPSGVTPPPLPPGVTSGWYTVITVSLPAPGPVPANSTRTIPFSIDTCAGGVAPYPGAKDMRNTASVRAGKTYTARSLTFALPAKCPVCGNGIRENGEQCDLGYGGGACCSTACQFRPNGTACNDGNACTTADQCQSGSCTSGSPVSCTASDQCHSAGTCNPATGLCSNPAKANGTTCDDHNACTQTDTCLSGVCRGGSAVSCAAAGQCQVGTCDPATGSCSSQPKADGAECMDGDACTVGDHCGGGECVSGAAADCSDHLSCTDDACQPATGCEHADAPTCDGCDTAECAACGAACDAQSARCSEGCWSGFMACLDGCTSTYCAPFCQVDLGRCLEFCPSATTCRQGCDTGNGCAAGCTAP